MKLYIWVLDHMRYISKIQLNNACWAPHIDNSCVELHYSLLCLLIYMYYLIFYCDTIQNSAFTEYNWFRGLTLLSTMKHRGRDWRPGFYSAILIILTLNNRIIDVLEQTESIKCSSTYEISTTYRKYSLIMLVECHILAFSV